MRRIAVANSPDIAENAVSAVRAERHALIITRVAGRAYALENKCPHMGLPLTRGRLDGTTLQCPFHGSRFDVCSGKNLDWVTGIAGMKLPDWSRSLIAMGKKPSDLRAFPTEEEAGKIYVTLPE